MAAELLIFGAGYTGTAIAEHLRAQGWHVQLTSRSAGAALNFLDDDAVVAAIGRASHLLSTAPPAAGEGDPVLARYDDAINRFRGWKGYLSSTGVYGDCGGAWVDETAQIRGRRADRNAADAAWLALGARVFRLPGIYGPGRSPLDRVAQRQAHRIDLPGQVFSRIHSDDIVSGVVAGFDAPAGAYNLADELPCSQNDVVAYAAGLLGMPPPPLQSIDEAQLSPAARAFYAENRRVANGKARRVLRWAPRYPDYRVGLRALSAMNSPAMASAAPPAASGDQR